MAVVTKTHDWVEMQLTPVAVIGEESDGRPALMAVDESDTRVMCGECGAPLNDETKNGLCTGGDYWKDLGALPEV